MPARTWLLSLLASLAAGPAAAALSWSDRAPVDPVRSNHGGGVINGTIYVAGGGYVGGFNWVSYATARAYDPVSDGWLPIAAMSVKRTWPGSTVARKQVSPGVLEPRLYVIGGTDLTDFPIDWTNHSSIELYDPASDAWSPFPQQLPPGLDSGMAAVTVGNLVYVLGGDDVGSSTCSNLVYVLDPVAETLAPYPSRMPSPAGFGYAEGAAVAIGNVIYYAGGWEDQYGVPSATLTRLDLTTGIWSTGAPMPHAAANVSAVAIGASVYVFGGWDGATQSFNDTLVYDTVANLWSSDSPLRCLPGVPPLAGRNGTSAHLATVSGQDYIYVLGGSSTNQNELSCHEYTAAGGCGTPPPPPDIGNRLFLTHPGAVPLLDWSTYPTPASASHYHVHRATQKTALPGPTLAEPVPLTFSDATAGSSGLYQLRAAIDCGDLESAN